MGRGYSATEWGVVIAPLAPPTSYMDFPMDSSKCLSSATFSSSVPLPSNKASLTESPLALH